MSNMARKLLFVCLAAVCCIDVIAVDFSSSSSSSFFKSRSLFSLTTRGGRYRRSRGAPQKKLGPAVLQVPWGIPRGGGTTSQESSVVEAVEEQQSVSSLNTSMIMTNRCLRLRSCPDGKVSKTDLELCDEEIPSPEEGQILVKNLIASIDPTHRIWMNGQKKQYMDPVPIGDIMRAVTVGVVVESKNEEWPVGKKVVGFGGISDYYVGIPGVSVLEMCACESDKDVSETFELTYGGIVIGLTAWHGIRKIIEAKEGDVIVISGGAGAVGSVAGQLSKAVGATVIGIAGGSEKCTFMKEELGFNFAIDYKSENIAEKLSEYAPGGVDGYFDNVGGDATEAVFLNAKNGMKMALCGSISEYDDKWDGIKNFNMILMRRIEVKGFICMDHMDELAEARAEIVQLKKDGKLTFREDIREGIENYVDVVNQLFCGGNKGKLMLRINNE